MRAPISRITPIRGIKSKTDGPSTVPEPLDVLREAVRVTGSQKAAASHLKVSPQYLSDVLRGRREISRELARKLGYQRIVIYMPLPVVRL